MANQSQNNQAGEQKGTRQGGSAKHQQMQGGDKDRAASDSEPRAEQSGIDPTQPMQTGSSQQGSRQSGGSDLESSGRSSAAQSGSGSARPGRQTRDASERPEAPDDDLDDDANRDALSRPAGGSPNTPRT